MNSRKKITQLVKELYFGDLQQRVNWAKRPDGWPLEVPFVDPNNPIKGSSNSKKPRKDILHTMLEHLLKQKGKLRRQKEPMTLSRQVEDDNITTTLPREVLVLRECATEDPRSQVLSLVLEKWKRLQEAPLPGALVNKFSEFVGHICEMNAEHVNICGYILLMYMSNLLTRGYLPETWELDMKSEMDCKVESFLQHETKSSTEYVGEKTIVSETGCSKDDQADLLVASATRPLVPFQPAAVSSANPSFEGAFEALERIEIACQNVPKTVDVLNGVELDGYISTMNKSSCGFEENVDVHDSVIDAIVGDVPTVKGSDSVDSLQPSAMSVCLDYAQSYSAKLSYGDVSSISSTAANASELIGLGATTSNVCQMMADRNVEYIATAKRRITYCDSGQIEASTAEVTTSYSKFNFQFSVDDTPPGTYMEIEEAPTAVNATE